MRIASRSTLQVIVFGWLAGLTEIVSAQAGAMPPQPLAQPRPSLPTNRAERPVEAWAIVRYSVLADGTTDDVRVVETVPSEVDTEPMIASVRRWMFSPATEQGKAVDWHNAESLVTYRAEDGSATQSADFAERYAAIRALLEGEPPIDFETALQMNETLLEESAAQIRELGVSLAQRALIAIATEDWHTAYDSIRLATDARISALSGEDLFVALQLRLQIANTLGRARDALATSGRIAAELGPGREDPFAGMAQVLRDKIENEETLAVAGYIGGNPWRITAGRRIFTIADVDGTVAEIDVECDRRKLSLEYQADVEWQLPAAWGECELFVVGDPGTRFRLFEFLAPAEPTP
jgi:hypothetical protein